MRFAQWLNENTDPTLSSLFARLNQEVHTARQSGGTGGKNFTMTAQEFQSLQQMAATAKQRVLASLQQMPQDWQTYLAWEKQHGSKHLSFALFQPLSDVVFKIGPTTQPLQDGSIQVTKALYDTLTWRKYIKGFEQLIQGQVLDLVQGTKLLQGMRLLKNLM